MAPRRSPLKPAYALFFAALITLPLSGSAQKPKTSDIVTPGAGSGPNAAPASGASAITPVTLAVPPANSAPQTVSMAPAAAVAPPGALVSAPMPTPAAAAAPKKTSSPQAPKTRGASIVPSRNAPPDADDRAPKAGSIDFDGSLGRKELESDPTISAAGSSAHPSIRRPYQLALVGNRVIPASLVTRLDALVAARHPSDRSDTLKGLANTIRTANIVAGMAKSAKEQRQNLLIFAALLRGIPLTDPDVKALFVDFQDELSFDKNLMRAVIAASDLDPGSGRQKQEGAVAAALAADDPGKRARLRLWADRWGRRLSFAAEIAAFTGTNADVLRAGGTSERLRVLMEDSSFALLPETTRANLEETTRVLRSKEVPPSAAGMINESARAQAPPRKDSSVELEIDTDPKVLNLLTTSDGTVGGLLGSLTSPNNSPARDVLWDALSFDEKMRLLRYVSQRKKTDFFKDRRVPRVKVKKKVVLKFDKETTFLGKTYPPGRHLVDVSRGLRDIVEYRGPNEVKDVTGVELHFRDNQSAGAVSNDARRLLEGIGVAITHQHVHIVAPLPLEALERDPNVQAAAMGDFFRRVNLMAEMTTIIDQGYSIDLNEVNDITYFGYATPWTISGVTQYFKNVGERRISPIRDRYKIGWVGFRGSDKYDQPGLYGLEYRSISASVNEADYRDILDLIQQSMLRDDYGIAKDRIRRWLSSRKAAKAVTDAWYNNDWPTVIKSATAGIKKELDLEEPGFFKKIMRAFGFGKSWVDQLTKLDTENTELKMLVYDWSNDPLVFDDQALQKRIEAQQIRALTRYKAGDKINAVVSDFLVDSGLYAAVARSIGPSGR